MSSTSRMPGRTFRPNLFMFVLGALAVVVSAWGLYSALTAAGAPGLIAVLAIAGFELFALGLGVHAVKVAQDGDSPAPFTAGLILIAIAGAFVQFSSALAEGKGWTVGVILAMMPIAAITLWAAELRRHFRLRGRAAGIVAAPAATFEPALWLFFRRATLAAKRMAWIDRTLGANDAFLLGMKETAPRPKVEAPAYVPPARVARNIRAEDVVPALAQREAEQLSTATVNGQTFPAVPVNRGSTGE